MGDACHHHHDDGPPSAEAVTRALDLGLARGAVVVMMLAGVAHAPQLMARARSCNGGLDGL